jgi:hypothetical protein
VHGKSRGYTKDHLFYHHLRTTQVGELGCPGVAKYRELSTEDAKRSALW